MHPGLMDPDECLDNSAEIRVGEGNEAGSACDSRLDNVCCVRRR